MNALRSCRLTRDELSALLEAHLEQIGAGYAHAHRRRIGLRMLLDWLEQAEGERHGSSDGRPSGKISKSTGRVPPGPTTGWSVKE